MARPKKIIESVAGENPAAEIVEAPVSKKEKSYVIAASFNDKDNFSISYKVGDNIPDSFDSERIESLLKLGLIKEK